MTVAELIEKLREMPQDATVAVPHEWATCGNIAADTVELYDAKPGDCDGEFDIDSGYCRNAYSSNRRDPIKLCVIS